MTSGGSIPGAPLSLFKKKKTIFQKRSNTIIISIPRNASLPHHFLADSKSNLRTSLFEEGAPDVGQSVAQEPT